MSRRAAATARHLGATLRSAAARRDRAAQLIGEQALRGPLSVAELARAVGISPRTVRRYRDRAAQNVGKQRATARDARADISAPDAQPNRDDEQNALRALRRLSTNGRAPSVRTYRADRRAHGAPSVERVEQLFGSWRAAVLAADLEPRNPGRPRKR